MKTLERGLRRELEATVRQARDIAEIGARDALRALGVGESKVPSHLTEPDRNLRRRLRAHGRQLGDKLSQDDSQELQRIAHEVAYEHWHRILFARFLSENHLLIHPEHGVALSLEDVAELAREKNLDPWELSAAFAERILPGVFRRDDPVLQVALPPESRSKLAALLHRLPTEVFVSDDSLGWVYQFWQAKRKDQVNAAGSKIGADEISPVTQLFTEDYMVEFLLHNTLGAWWAGKVIRDDLATTFTNEDEARAAARVGDVDWKYLRFVHDQGKKTWRPAAGVFPGWPNKVADITVLDPCMGSGHFLVFALPILVAMRQSEERLDVTAALQKVLQENLFGLEIDSRCTQIAEFNLALASWKLGGYRALPELNLACSGLGVNASKEEWGILAGENKNLRLAMGQLHDLFSNAPILGSLINLKESPLLKGKFVESADLYPALREALGREDVEEELATQALGMAKAARIFAGQFTLVATNVPYLKSSKHDSILKDFCERVFPRTKADLATVFIERCVQFCRRGGSVALVTPQTWLFLGAYNKFRSELLTQAQWNCLARLGPSAFETISGEVVNIALLALSHDAPSADHLIAGIDADPGATAELKAQLLCEGVIQELPQINQLRNPDARINFGEVSDTALLQLLADAYIGQRTGDGPRFILSFWEFPNICQDWVFFGTTVERTSYHGGLHQVLLWENGSGQLAEYQALLAESVYASGGWKQGWQAWGKCGIRVSQMGDLPVTLHSGSHFDNNCAVIVPKNAEHLSAIWTFCESPQFRALVRQIDQSLKVTNATLVKIPFDLAHWQKVAAEKYPQGLPKPFSSDPRQWLFNGEPSGADQPLHVAVARLLGYQWPRQTGSSFPDCPVLGSDGLEKLADQDGIVCLPSARGEEPAADRLRNLLATAYGKNWAKGTEQELVRMTGSSADRFDDWLRQDFFEQHCKLFHHRPFIWQIWDGRKDGFNALINYHKLTAPNGEGRRLLESLTHSYLNDWISRQQESKRMGEEGSEGRLAAALELKTEFQKILDGEPPYDIFVRWKPLHNQPIGWDPDINDGVRVNIRPFMVRGLSQGKKGAGILKSRPNIKWEKDRGKEPNRAKEEFPWLWNWDETSMDFPGGNDFDGNRWNDCHYSNAIKRKARESAK